jgi:hypothetical protein
MPPPILPPLIPKPDIDEDVNQAVKKAALLAGGIGSAYFFNQKFPVATPKVSNFAFGFEPKPAPSRMIKIKPGFLLAVAPEPLGATPPSLTGLPRYTDDPMLFLSQSKLKQAADRDAKAFIDQSVIATMRLIQESEPALRQRDEAFVRAARDKSLAALQQLGPRPDTHNIGRVRPGDIDSRVFYSMVAQAAQQELDRRAEERIDQANVEPLQAKLPPVTFKYTTVYIPERDSGAVVQAQAFADPFFAANPADP